MRLSRLLSITLSLFVLVAAGSLAAAADDESKPPESLNARGHSLPPLEARGVNGIREISRAELEKLMTTERPLLPEETANLNRGCVGLVCLYQGLELKKWPEAARGTRAYLRREDALRRRCPDGQENFVFVKQAWWVSGTPPRPDADGQVPLSSITREKPGWYTFNYGAFFPDTATYAWINHREYGFPINIIKPQKVYLSHAPPPLNEGRTAEVFCSTCR